MLHQFDERRRWAFFYRSLLQVILTIDILTKRCCYFDLLYAWKRAVS